VAGLLALMLLTDARRGARTGPHGELVPLAVQDRLRWDAALIDEGVALITDSLARTPIGPYQLQAAIAAVHAEAPDDAGTDWAEIAALYDLLGRVAPNPMVTLNHAVAVGRHEGPRAGLALLAPLHADRRTARHHRLHAVRGHLLELVGDTDAARAAYQEAARLTSSLPERRYLEGRAAALPLE
jgi:predicted RNA polymerase sigma factor